MNTLKVIGFTEAKKETQEIYSQVKTKIGMLPNLYASMGVSDKLLGGFLTYRETIQSGEFTAKEYEAIALITSQENGCAYCISAHSALAKMNGFTEKDTLSIRDKSIEDPKSNALVNLASQLVIQKGKPEQTAVNNFLEAGYNKAAFAELIAAVALTTITNTIYHNGGFEIDFPKAQEIEHLINS